jgi:leucyl aminopeptidase
LVRITKNVEKWRVHTESSFKSSYDYQFQMAMCEGKALSTFLARTRGSDATPEWMEKELRKITKGQSAVKELKIIKGNDLLKHGMNCFHAVGRAATSAPRACFVKYIGRPGDKTIDLAIVGKGVTYDTGGLNIKMALMEKMHGDKGGATAVMGALKGCLKMKVKKNIIFCCAFAENAIGNMAYKPSDILRAKNGLSVEIGNTDAEGRLVMCDTATYA